MTDSFLNRWAKRKQDVRDGKPLADPAAKPAHVPVAEPSRVVVLAENRADAAKLGGGGQPVPNATPANSAPTEPVPELPTLADTQSLTPESDFKPFMARGVATDVKNAAMKKLFTDPHFNVMDRLDTYIDDYSLADPIPPEMLRKMVSAKFLNLFDDEESVKDEASAGLDAADHPTDRPAPNPADHPADEPVANTDKPPLEAPQGHLLALREPSNGPAMARDDPDAQNLEAVPQSVISRNPRTLQQP